MAYVINLGEYILIGTYWVALYVNGDKMTYFDSFKHEYIKKVIRKIIGKKYHDNIFMEYKHMI